MLQMHGIYKDYGTVRANRGIDLTVAQGKIVGLLGENGSGKSTLMKILFGMVRPDAGKIIFKGRELSGHKPRDAITAGLGMIHQHFMLVNAMTVTENVMLGWQSAGQGLRLRELAELIRSTSITYGLEIDPNTTVGELSYGRRQRVEIIKAIIWGADLLVLDEPTSNLTPPEVARLLDVMRRLREQGRSVIFISHKLGEVLEVCDEIVVLRDGEVVGKSSAAAATKTSVAQMMFGHDIRAEVERTEGAPGPEVLTVRGLSKRDEAGVVRLHDVTLSLRAGEIFAVAGVDGNGQAELVDVIAGLKLPDQGSIMLGGRDITCAGVQARLAAGISYIPVDRAGTSLVPGMSVEDNLALRDFTRPPLSRGGLLDYTAFRSFATYRMAHFEIRAAGPEVPARTLSGGNQQKIVLAREIGRNPKVLVAYQPAWGLDAGATSFVIDQVLALRETGGAILYISAELEEVLTLGDRIAVIYNGRLSQAFRRQQVNVTEIGLMMAGAAQSCSAHEMPV